MGAQEGPAAFSSGREKQTFVRGMFNAIAPRYDRLNRVVSLGFDERWRALAAQRVAPVDGAPVFVDVGCGTGDLARKLAERHAGARVVGVDIAGQMLRLAKSKRGLSQATFAEASGLTLPFGDARVDGITNGFVLRNVADLDAFFRECARALKPGGRLVSLEINRPPGRLFGPLYELYFFKIMPRVARRLSGHPVAYDYLADSVARVESPERMAQRMRDAGFARVAVEPLMRGAVILFTAHKASAPQSG